MKLRVVFTIAGLTPESGGPSRSVPALACALADCGMDVHIVTLDFLRRESPPLLPDSNRVTTHLVQCRGSRRIPTWWLVRFQRALTNCSGANQFVLLHDNGAWLPTNHVTAGFSRKHGVPLVISPRGMLATWSIQHKSVRKRWAWRLYQERDLATAKLFHVTSEEEAGEIRQLGFRQPIAVIPNGVQVPDSIEGAKAGGLRTVLFLSRIHRKKGLFVLLESWAQARKPGWRLIIAGPGETSYVSEVRNRIEALNLNDSVSVRGPADGKDKAELFMGASLFVLPSFSENFGIVVAEALAFGVPVITTRSTPWSRLVEHRCGWWVDAEVNALTRALKAGIALEDSERHEMGQRGRRLMQEQFSWPSVGKRMRAAYDWLCGRGPLPDCVIKN